jgi:hypothetical protein
MPDGNPHPEPEQEGREDGKTDAEQRMSPVAWGIS